jgi:hypothetical protein
MSAVGEELGDVLMEEIEDDHFGDLGDSRVREQVDVLRETTEKAPASARRGGAPPKVPEWKRERDGEAVRARRSTVVSPIPALLAKSMGQVSDHSAVRDPAAPVVAHQEITRRVVDEELNGPGARGPGARDTVDRGGSSGYSVELVDGSKATARESAAVLILRARACMERGDLGGAVLAADEVLAEGERAKVPGIADLLEAARPLFDQIFASYIGLLGEVPILARSPEEISAMELDDKTQTLVSRINGILTLEKLFSVSKIPAVEAVRIAATLLSDGIIRVR